MSFERPKRITPLSPRQLFKLNISEVKSVLGNNNIDDELDITVPNALLEDNQFNRLRSLEDGVAAHVFITKDRTAHVVYFPGVSTDKPKKLSSDIPLSHIVRAVDAYFSDSHEKRYTSVKKYMTVGVYAQHIGREDHYVAVTKVDSQLTVINPKGSMLASGSNPDPTYLENLVDNINPQPLAAGLQGMTDTTSCGYIVAGIHAKSAAKPITKSNFSEKMKEINVDEAIAAAELIKKGTSTKPAMLPGRLKDSEDEGIEEWDLMPDKNRQIGDGLEDNLENESDSGAENANRASWPFNEFFSTNYNKLYDLKLYAQFSKILNWDYQSDQVDDQGAKLTQAMIILKDAAGKQHNIKDELNKLYDTLLEITKKDINALRQDYPFAWAYQQLKTYLKKIKIKNHEEGSINALWDQLDKIACDKTKPTEEAKLEAMEQVVLNTYYTVRGNQGFLFDSRLADALKDFITHKGGLGVSVKYHIDIPQTVNKGKKAPNLQKWARDISPKKTEIPFEFKANDDEDFEERDKPIMQRSEWYLPPLVKDIRQSFYVHFKKHPDFVKEYKFVQNLLTDINEGNIYKAMGNIQEIKKNTKNYHADFLTFLRVVLERIKKHYPKQVAIHQAIDLYKEELLLNVGIQELHTAVDIDKSEALRLIAAAYPKMDQMPPFIKDIYKDIQKKNQLEDDSLKAFIDKRFYSYEHGSFFTGRRSFKKDDVNSIRNDILTALNSSDQDPVRVISTIIKQFHLNDPSKKNSSLLKRLIEIKDKILNDRPQQKRIENTDDSSNDFKF